MLDTQQVIVTPSAAEERLYAAFEAACDAPPSVPLQSSICEVQRKAESVGLTSDEMDYWAERLEGLTAATLAD